MTDARPQLEGMSEEHDRRSEEKNAHIEPPPARDRVPERRSLLLRAVAWLVALAVPVFIVSQLVLPPILGYLTHIFVHGGVHALEISGDGSSDPVTALKWTSGSERLFVGTVSGRRLVFDRAGTLIAVESATGSPIVGFSSTIDPSSIYPITLASRQTSNAVTGDIAAKLHSGPETCVSGYVWRAAFPSDLICVTPESRDRAFADNAAAQAGQTMSCAGDFRPGFLISTTDAGMTVCLSSDGTVVIPPDVAGIEGCFGDLVPRLAVPDDVICVAAQTRDETAEENRLDQFRKVLPLAAREGDTRLRYEGVEGEHGMLAVSGNFVLAGSEPTGASTTAQDAATGNGLSQWSLAEIPPVEVSELSGIFDARVVAAIPDSPFVVVGDGAGGVYLVEASAQISGVNPLTLTTDLGRHEAAVTAIAVADALSADNPSFATAAEDGSIKVWWVSSSKVTLIDGADVVEPGTTWQRGPSYSVKDYFGAVSDADQGYFVADDTIFSFADGQTLTPLVTIAGGWRPPMAFSPNGDLLVANDPSAGIIIYNLKAESTVVPAASVSNPVDFAFSPDGSRFVTATSDSEILMTDTSGVPLWAYNTADALTVSPVSVAYSPDGSMVSALLTDGRLLLLQASDGTLLAEYSVPAAIRSSIDSLAPNIAFGPSGRTVLIAMNGVITTYSIRRQTSSEKDPSGILQGLSSDGTRYASLGFGLSVGEVETLRESPIRADLVGNARLSAHGTVLATEDNGTVDLLIEGPQDNPDDIVPPPPVAQDGLRISADGSRLLLREPGGALHVADLTDPNEGRVTLVPIASGLVATAAELFPDGNTVVAADASGVISLIDIATDDLTQIHGHGNLVNKLAVSPDGTLLASADLDGRLRITDLTRIRGISGLPFADLASTTGTFRLETRYLDASTRPGVQLFFQFAGMSRETAQAWSAELQKLGWSIPGEEERPSEAAGVNEVRHNPEDAITAGTLADDLVAMGRNVTRVQTTIIKPGTIEVWISDDTSVVAAAAAE
ncbi:MAG: hypothetical protein JWR51_3438 [Devosia sp.]|uniref:WD40 repeat domain-containing protein n=1 Tax=Devosia sp. TaxID=1871048 RepID=UPI002607CE70|nr:WD40 repeat domain-containing protein [Devosia sp.]MDB5530335.1 hypothetical protein [Devosia sp.]